MDIKFFNTLNRKKEVFKPIRDGEVGIYTCGPTVYNYAHIGNLRAYVFADTLRRALEVNGYKVHQIINITDVGHLASDSDEGEDKLEKGAQREGRSVWDIAKFYEKAFIKDLEELNIEMPQKLPRATDHIEDMIRIIKILEDRGFTYVAGGNVYFDTTKLKDYGKLAKLCISPEEVRSRVEADPNKKHPFDFVLWFTKYKYASHEMQWDSPWGKGFPGWHIECSAMASKYLGNHFDIHTGGIDHVPIHHTNEMAQSEAAFGHQWVNFWLHNDWLIVDKEKMSKSSGEFLRLKTVEDKGYSPMDFRYYLLTGHYRTKLNFSWEALDNAKNSRERLVNKISEISHCDDEEVNKKYEEKFLEAINDDLNTAKALSIVWETIDDKELSNGAKFALISFYDKALGLELTKIKTAEIPDEVCELAKVRWEAREAKDWQKSDDLREKISKMGYEILDKKDNYEIRKK